MTTFLNPDFSGISFINFKQYINELFSKHSIFLVCAKGKVDIVKENYCDSFIVKCNNLLLEGNLRMVDSYLPELLFHLVVNDSWTAGNSINSLVNSNSGLDKDYIKYKLFRLFEAIIFSDFFESVFRGDINVNVCYVLKANKLEYFKIADSGKLFNTVLEELYFDINRYEDNSSDILEIRILHKQKPH